MKKHHLLGRVLAPFAVLGFMAAFAWAQTPVIPLPMNKPSITFEVKLPHERMEMTVSTSRILTMEQKIPQAQVNNPDLLDLTPLSPTQIQVSAKKSGVTQINLWDEEKKLYTVDVIVLGDAQELKMLLKSQFPNCILNVVPVANSVLISGYVDKAEHVEKIVQIAQEFYPKVINNMTLGGVQQVLLHVKLMEVSRTKLRKLGFDWAVLTSNGSYGVGNVGGFLAPAQQATAVSAPIANAATSPYSFGVVSGGTSFFGILDALRHDNLLKVRAEPQLVTVSGRAASFTAGGQIPVPEPQSLGTISITWKEYGPKVDFVPLVLGNGKIRLEVRAEVSELDPAHSYTINGTTIPGILTRHADTAVEMTAGQTMAIAGLLYNREDSQNRGLPWVSDVPYLGVPFRHVDNTTNEIELLILVTPEFVSAMDGDEVPQCGPGMQTTTPNDWELYMKGHLEVPNCCPNGDPNGPPPDGMIGPEEISAPPQGVLRPDNRPNPRGISESGSAQIARRPNGASSYGRYNMSKPNPDQANSRSGDTNTPPPFVGPVGYDIIK